MKREQRLLLWGGFAAMIAPAAWAGSLTTDSLTVKEQTDLSGQVTIAPFVPSTNTCVLNYSFDSSATPVFDGSMYSNSGSVSGGAAWTNGGKTGGAYVFDGTNDYIQAEDSSSLDVSNGLTISAWARFNNSNSVRCLVAKHDDDSDRAYDLYFQDGKLYCQITSGGDGDSCYSIGSTGSVSSASWTHYVVTWDGTPNNNLRLYINGVTETVTTLQSAFASDGYLYNSGKPLRIGAKSNDGWYFSGAIDEVRIYNRALSPAEISSLYTGDPVSNTAPQSLSVSVAATFSGTTTITRLVPQGDIDMGVYVSGP